MARNFRSGRRRNDFGAIVLVVDHQLAPPRVAGVFGFQIGQGHQWLHRVDVRHGLNGLGRVKYFGWLPCSARTARQIRFAPSPYLRRLWRSTSRGRLASTPASARFDKSSYSGSPRHRIKVYYADLGLARGDSGCNLRAAGGLTPQLSTRSRYAPSDKICRRISLSFALRAASSMAVPACAFGKP